MVCHACGSAVAGPGTFCPRCGVQVPVPGGAAVYSAAPVPGALLYGSRVQRNLQTLSVLWFVYAGYRAIAGVVGVFFIGSVASRRFGMGDWPFHGRYHSYGPGWMSALVPVVMLYTLIAVGLALSAGYGLLTRQPWGRTVAIVAGVLALLKIPFGTGLGIYTLYVLAPEASAVEYEGIAGAQAGVI